MKNRSIGFIVAIAMYLSAMPAQAQVVTDPGATAALNAILVQQLHQTGQQMAALPKEILSEQHLLEQLKQMVIDHKDISDVIKGLGSDLVAGIKKNADIMYNTQNRDMLMNAEFARLVPKYQAGQDYLKYTATLEKNSTIAYAQALGVANDGVTNSKVISKKLDDLLKEPPSNQLQALQQILIVGGMQVQQMDKLLKIQAAMMKSMAVAYQKNQAGENGFNPKDGVTKYSVDQYCTNAIPMYAFLGSNQKDEAFNECKKSMMNRNK